MKHKHTVFWILNYKKNNMKKIIICLLLSFLTLTSFSLDVANGDLVTIGSTTATAIKVNKKASDYTTFTITVISGTLKVGVGSVSSNAYAFPAASKIIISCNNGSLYVKAGSNTDTFAITAN